MEEIEARARCRHCGGFSGLRKSGEPRAFCDAPECQFEKHRRARQKAVARLRERAARAKTRRCASCSRRKPRDEEHFYVTARHDDGSVMRLDSYCKPCRRADTRARYHGDPARRKRVLDGAARQRERIREQRERDPAFDREYRKRMRGYSAEQRRRRRGDAAPEPVVYLVDSEKGGWLPLAPLVEAIREREALLIATDVSAPRTVLAAEVGVTDRQLGRWLDEGEGDVVTLDTADRALIGLDLLWFDVWAPDEHPAVVEIFEADAELLAA